MVEDMSKAFEERMWYLEKYYGKGGWQRAHLAEAKKYQAMVMKLVKDGFLEQDESYDLFRITDFGLEALTDQNKQ
jgi:hypothetical protein